MKFYHPKSILRLILTGFLLVTLPLIFALVVATVAVDRMVGHSQNALFQSVLVTQGTQVLEEAITAMERNARQYQVLGDKVLLEVYLENHARFIDTSRSLEFLELEQGQRKLLEELSIGEDELHTVLVTYPHDATETEAALPAFNELAQIAQQILIDNQSLISRGAEQISDQAKRVQRLLVMQAVALAPVALLLSLFFAYLITRPIRQVDQAIRRLGDGEFSKPASVKGPRDLEQIGERLDWLRNRLLELEQEKSKFLQHVSHELKTPLTTIREGAELLRDEVVGKLNGEQREIAGILNDNSLQLQKLIESLLNFSSLRSRSSCVLRDRVELHAVIEDVLEDHKLAMLARKLVPQTSLDPVTVCGDQEKLRIMVDNLISNAIKYSPDGSPLMVSLSATGSDASIDVVDAGPGIPAGERERVFEAFYQGTPASKGHVRGTGLGLSIAREYAQEHGGDIHVLDSNEPGTHFQVVLPLGQGT